MQYLDTQWNQYLQNALNLTSVDKLAAIIEHVIMWERKDAAYEYTKHWILKITFLLSKKSKRQTNKTDLKKETLAFSHSLVTWNSSVGTCVGNKVEIIHVWREVMADRWCCLQYQKEAAVKVEILTFHHCFLSLNVEPGRMHLPLMLSHFCSIFTVWASIWSLDWLIFKLKQPGRIARMCVGHQYTSLTL